MALGPHASDGPAGRRRGRSRPIPQFHLKLLLDRIGVARGEVRRWRRGGGRDAPAARSRAVANAMASAAFTRKWQRLEPRARRLTGIRALELADPAEEAQAVAIALREALEQPGRTAALVTPDRTLARRVSAHLRRWGIEADDSAGPALVADPARNPAARVRRGGGGTVRAGAAARLAQASAGHAGDAGAPRLAGRGALARPRRARAAPAGGPRRASPRHLADQVAPRRRPRALVAVGGDAAAPARTGVRGGHGASPSGSPRSAQPPRPWRASRSGPGRPGAPRRSCSRTSKAAAGQGPEQMRPAELPVMLERLMAAVAVRPPYGQHPRLFIWGLLEARLQQADLMVLAGLNEGVWPSRPPPDPWLAPRLRAELGLPPLERRIGLAAHDFAGALGAPAGAGHSRPPRRPRADRRLTLLAPARGDDRRRDARAARSRKWARALDRPAAYRPAGRPAPSPKARPRDIWVTDVDRLKADPFAFYARRILGLRRLDPVDADPTPAWRGSAVHEVLEQWMKEDDCDPAKLRPRARGAARRRGGASADARLVAAAPDRGDRLHRRRGREESRRRPPAAGGRGWRGAASLPA